MKYTVTFSKGVDEVINSLSESEKVSKPEILRRALALYNFLYKEKQGGSSVFVKKEGHEDKEIVWME